jgi:hydrogenase-4 component B
VINTVFQLFIAFFIMCAVGAGASLIAPARSIPLVLAIFAAIAALIILIAGGLILVGDGSFRAELWSVLSLGKMTLAADRLSALFLLATGIVFLPVAIFSGSYLNKYLGHYNLRYFGVLYFVLLASVVLVLVANDVLSFLVAWEFMSIASYLLVNFEYERKESSQAGFVMLAMSEAGTIAVAVAFLLVAGAAGGLEFDALRSAGPSLGHAIATSVFLLSFFGFAVKAGLVPVNSWLPLAHPVAPTNVSALLSAVIVNLGIYGIVRFNLDLVPVTTSGPGIIVLVVGSFSALIGILYATVESEMKRLLAHSTIENMGIIAAGIGAAMIFLASGHQIVAGIALIAAMYHLVNHSVYKALLFLGTGAVEAGAQTRDLDRLGGLVRLMPWTSVFFLVGVMAISALPPLNGFVSEWLTLQTVLRSVLLSSTAVKIVFAVSGAMLALTAGLAVTCFIKVFAMGFLGMARSDGAANATEARLGMRAPLALLAATCILLGLLPTYVIPALDRGVVSLTHASATVALVPPFFNGEEQRKEAIPPKFLTEFHDLGAQVGAGLLPGRGLVVLHRGGEQNPVVFAMSTSYMVLALASILLLTFVAFKLAARGRMVARRAVWAGGLRRLWPGITYTATGFSNPVRVIFGAVLHPAAGEDSTEAVAQHFRTAIRRDQVEAHIVDRWVLDPPISGLRSLAAIVRKMHVGNVNAYAAYVLVAMLVVLIIGAGIF